MSFYHNLGLIFKDTLSLEYGQTLFHFGQRKGWRGYLHSFEHLNVLSV